MADQRGDSRSACDAVPGRGFAFTGLRLDLPNRIEGCVAKMVFRRAAQRQKGSRAFVRDRG